MLFLYFFFFFFNDTATTEIYTLSLHDALPICAEDHAWRSRCADALDSARIRFLARVRDGNGLGHVPGADDRRADRKSTRLNSSHVEISYAVFCLKKKKKN